MKVYYSTVVLTIIIAMTYNLFYLFPLTNAQGGSNLADVAQLLLWAALVFALLRSTRLSILANRVSWMVFLYLLLVGIEIVLATFYHGQSLKDGIIAAREQYFYVSFFLFLLLLDDTKKLHQFLNVLTVIVLVVFAFAIVDYVGYNVFYQPKEEGRVVIRAGIERIFIPGLRLASMVFIWQFARWLSMDRRDRLIPGLLVVILLAEHFFRQSRGPIFGVLVAAIGMLIVTRQYRLLFKGGMVVLVATLVTGVVMEENIMTRPFTSSAEELQAGSVEWGSWSQRLKQMEFAWEQFKEHPWLGSGGTALRVSTYEGDARSASDVFALAYKADLGYTKILQTYGLVGVSWLVAFLWMLASMARRAIRVYRTTREPLLLFAAAYTLYVIFSMVTLNHFMFATASVLLFIVAGILVRNDRNMLIEKETDVPAENLAALQGNATAEKRAGILRRRKRGS